MIPSAEIMLQRVIHAAMKAGNEIMSIYKGNFKIDFKADLSPLTDADRRSHEVIHKELKDFSIPVISEESEFPDYEIRKSWEYLWLVDPLDGTKEFISRNGEFTVNIALIKNGIPIMGVIYAPVPDEMYFASETYGSHKISDFSETSAALNLQEIIALSEKLPIKRSNSKFIVVASRSHMNPETIDYIEKLREENGEIVTISRGSSLKLCMIAEGSADVYPRFGTTMEWDVAAGHAIVKYAGGNVKNDMNNEELIYNKNNLKNSFFIATMKNSIKIINFIK